VRKTTKLIEGGHRGFQDYRHTSTFFLRFLRFLKIQKVVTFFTFFAVFRTFSRTMLLSSRTRSVEPSPAVRSVSRYCQTVKTITENSLLPVAFRS